MKSKHYNILKTTALMVLFFFLCLGGKAQTVIALQNFESSGSSMTYSNSGGSTKSGSSASGDRPQSATFYTSSNNGFWVNNNTATLTFANVTGLGSYLNKKVTFRLAAFSIGATNNGPDASDAVILAVSLNNGSSYSNEIEVDGESNSYWHYTTGIATASDTYDGDNNPTDFSPSGGGNRTSDGYSTVTLDLPSNATQVKIRITMDNSNNNEAWLIDDVKITGCALTLSAGNSGPICSGSTLNLNASGTGVSYSWSGPNGFTSSSQNPSIVGATSAASGTYTVTATSASGCTASITTAATVNIIPSATASSSNPACTGSNLNLTSGPNGYSYQWSGPAGYSSTSQNPTRTNIQASYAGTYTVTITNAGCSSTASTSVSVNTSPNASASNNGPLCTGSALDLTSTGGATYQWSGPAGFSSTQQNPVRSNAQSNYGGTYTVTVTSANGCTASATTSATVNTTPSAVASSNTPVCTGNSINLTSSGSGSYSYQWSGPNGYSSTSQNPTRTNSQPNYGGTYTVTVTNAGCVSSASTTVAVNAPPNATASSNGPVCSGANLNLTSTGGGTYQWSGPAGFTSSSQNPVHSNIQVIHAGTYTVTVTNGGCSATATTAVTVNPTPISSPSSSPANVCSGAQVNLTGSSQLPFTNPTATAIPDNNTSGVNISVPVPATNISSASLLEVSITFNPEHTYAGDLIVKLTAPGGQVTTLFDRLGGGNNSDDLNGTYVFSTSGGTVMPENTGTNSTNGNINPGTYKPSDANGNGHNWTGFTFPLNASSGNWVLNVSDRANTDVGTVASWSLRIKNASGVAYSWSSNSSGFTASTQNAIDNPLAATIYTLQTNFNGCLSNSTSNASVSPAPQPVANSNAPVCTGTFLGFSSANSASGQTTGNTYSWTGPNGFNSSNQNPSLGTATLVNSGNYTVTITNQFGCTASVSTLASVNPNPSVNIASQTNVSCNGLSDATYTIAANGGLSPYIFTDGISVNTDGIFYGLNQGSYTVDVYDDNGCSSTSNVSITEPAVLTASALIVQNEQCPGAADGAINVISNGGTPTYSVNGSVNDLSPGSYSYTVTDAHGCTTSTNAVSIATDKTISTTAVSALTNASFICTPASATLSVNGGSLGTGANWKWYSGSCGGTLVGTGSSISVTPSADEIYFVRAEGDCNSSLCVPVSIDVSTAPPAGSIHTPLTGPLYACNTNTATVSANNVGNTATYVWDGPSGTTFDGANSSPYNSNDPNVDVTFGQPNGSGYYICVQAVNGCGSSNRKCLWIRGTVNTPTAILPANNRAIECANTSANYSIAPVGGATSYNWSVTGDATIVPNGTSATVNFGSAWTGGTICVSASTPCYTGASRCLAINTTISTPGAITGATSVCPNSSVTYTVPAVGGSATYNWTVPNHSFGSSTSNSINVNFNSNFNFGDIKVNITSICGLTSSNQSKTINKGTAATPGNITGPASGLCGQTVVASCPVVAGATSYTWSVPSGATINSGQNSTSINVSFGSLSNSQICVTANNGCGSGNPRCMNIKGSPTAPSSIQYTPFCANQSGVDLQVAPVFGTTGYAWSFPSGVSTILDLGNEQIVNWGANGGVVSLTVSNACGNATKNQMINPSCREIAPADENNSTFDLDKVSVYPNPAHDNLNISFNSNSIHSAKISLMDMAGRTVLSNELKTAKGENNHKLNLADFAKGVYMITLENGNSVHRIKVTVE